MTNRRSRGNFLAMFLLLAAIILRDYWIADWLRYLALAYISVDLVLRARAGYLSRRPYWTPDSWRRYLKACSVPIGALVIVVLMMIAIEWKLPIAGASRSTTRGLWAAGIMVFMIIGAGGLVSAIESLNHGDPSQQFALPRWLTFGRGKAV